MAYLAEGEAEKTAISVWREQKVKPDDLQVFSPWISVL